MKLLPLLLALVICTPAHAQTRSYTFVRVTLQTDANELIGPRVVYALKELIDSSTAYRTTSELEPRTNYVVSLIGMSNGCGAVRGSAFSIALTRRSGEMIHHSIMHVPEKDVDGMVSSLWASIDAAIRPASVP